MSKRTADDQFKAPRKVWPDTQEENLTKRWDMEHVISRLDDIQDSIDQILAMLSGAAAKRIGRYKLRQAIKSVAERKYYDSTVTLSSAGNLLSTTGYMFVLTDMAQGSGTQNRIGDKCTGSSLEIRYLLTSPAAVTTVPILHLD